MAERIIDNCTINLCVPEMPSAAEMIGHKREGEKAAERIVIEFDKSRIVAFTISIGQRVGINDIIGYINNIAVRSQCEFTVLDMKENYIVGKK